MERKLKQALDESRLLILGAQVLFGFSLEACFKQGFDTLPAASRGLHALSVLLILASLALLITPSLFHQIACEGDDRRSVLRVASLCGGLSLLPLTLGLGLAIFIIVERALDRMAAIVVAGSLTLGAMALLYGWGFAVRESRKGGCDMPQDDDAPLSDKIDQMLTEARVMLPGAQTLLGFQLIVVLSESFDRLPGYVKIIHVVGLVAVALTATLLLSTAALHRIGYRGADDPNFFRIGSRLVVAATIPLAIAVAIDIFVVFQRVTERPALAAWTAAAAFGCLVALWIVFPTVHRALREKRDG